MDGDFLEVITAFSGTVQKKDSGPFFGAGRAVTLWKEDQVLTFDWFGEFAFKVAFGLLTWCHLCEGGPCQQDSDTKVQIFLIVGFHIREGFKQHFMGKSNSGFKEAELYEAFPAESFQSPWNFYCPDRNHFR